MRSEIALHPMRSKLFVPAVRPELFSKAMASDADAICLDLEDGVSRERKAEARTFVSDFLASLAPGSRPMLLVRINGTKSGELLEDLKAAVSSAVASIALPKVESVAEIQAVGELLGELESEREIAHPLGLLLTIESPRGLRLASELATSSQRIIGLQLGFADLLEPLGIPSSDTAARNQIRLSLRLAAAEGGVDCYESAYPHFQDEKGFRDQLTEARALGFAGASCIHPKQAPAANEIFSSTPDELEEAADIVAAYECAMRDGTAIAQIKGTMIDRPFFLRAKRILAAKTTT